jgi:hypothetical protein
MNLRVKSYEQVAAALEPFPQLFWKCLPFLADGPVRSSVSPTLMELSEIQMRISVLRSGRIATTARDVWPGSSGFT